MLDFIIINNHQVSIDNIYVTGDLAFLIILFGKNNSSYKWYLNAGHIERDS